MPVPRQCADLGDLAGCHVDDGIAVAVSEVHAKSAFHAARQG